MLLRDSKSSAQQHLHNENCIDCLIGASEYAVNKLEFYVQWFGVRAILLLLSYLPCSSPLHLLHPRNAIPAKSSVDFTMGELRWDHVLSSAHL